MVQCMLFYMSTFQDPYMIKYFDPTGLMQDKPNNITGNGVLYTAELFLAEHLKGNDPWKIYPQVASGLESCFDGQFFYRHAYQFRNDQQQIDDLVGLGILGRLGHMDLLIRVLDSLERGYTAHGSTIPWYYPTEIQYRTKFDLRAYLGRFYGLKHHLRRCANRASDLAGITAWKWGIMLTGELGQDNHDAWILSYLLANTPRPMSPAEESVKNAFSHKFKLKHGSMSALLEKYFTHRHPICDVFKAAGE